MGKEEYWKALREEELTFGFIVRLLDLFSKNGMKVEKLQESFLNKQKTTKYLRKLGLYICHGNSPWEGLLVGFPGEVEELSSENVGTPYLRKILYPIINLYRNLKMQEKKSMPCVYLLGRRFNDVFLRKFRFLNSLVPHVIVLTEDLRKCAETNVEKPPNYTKSEINEYFLQKKLCEEMFLQEGLDVPINKKASIKIRLISYEVPTVEGTKNPERLDILGYDVNDHSLVAFEIKGPAAGGVELENLFLQGMEHRNWLEDNKMAVKFIFDGPKDKRINSRKRVKLVLGLCKDKVPDLFYELKKQAMRKDKFIEIYFSRLIPPADISGEVRLASF